VVVSVTTSLDGDPTDDPVGRVTDTVLLLLPGSPPVAETVKPTVQLTCAPAAADVSDAVTPVTDVGGPAQAPVVVSPVMVATRARTPKTSRPSCQPRLARYPDR
jgi:hypothetical protein